MILVSPYIHVRPYPFRPTVRTTGPTARSLFCRHNLEQNRRNVWLTPKVTPVDVWPYWPYSLVLPWTVWYIVIYCLVLACTVSYWPVLSGIVPHRLVLARAVWYWPVLSSGSLYCLALACTVWYVLTSAVWYMPVLAPWGWPSRGGAVIYRLSPQLGEDSPLLRTRGYVILRGNRGGSVGSASHSGPMYCLFHPRN